MFSWWNADRIPRTLAKTVRKGRSWKAYADGKLMPQKLFARSSCSTNSTP